MSNTALSEVDHSLLRYANCWEDADLLLEALQTGEGAVILSIGSAGDNSFSLLSGGAERLVCLDLNSTQLALIRLKKAAFASLSHSAFLEFLGFVPGNPSRHWAEVAKALSPQDRVFWEARKQLLFQGIIFTGKFEKYLLTFQRKLLPMMHGAPKVEKLFSRKGEEEQQLFYQKHWNTWRWRLFTRLFFSRTALGRGRDPAFLKQVEGGVGPKIKEKIDRHLSSPACQESYFLHFMLKGHFDRTLPHYARPENFEKIKANLHRLETFHGSLADFDEKEKFTHANLSNIFEYQDEAGFTSTVGELNRLLKKHALVAYWNLLVPRQLSEAFPSRYRSLETTHLPEDKGFFYCSFNLDQKI